MRVSAAFSHQPSPRIPVAPAGGRVADLWEYDVVECFLVGSDGGYLELELGAGGHFLVLSFRAPRQRSDDHAALALAVAHRAGIEGWESEVLLPWDLVPADLCALNAFAIAGGRYLAHASVPGPVPDFHQPGAFPRARVVGRPATRR